MKKVIRITESELKEIIFESKKGLLWIRRRMSEPEILKHIKDIVDEGFDYVDPCDYKNGFESYLNDIVYGSVQTFINSYDELYKSDDDRHILESFVYKFIELKYRNYIKENYNYWIEECE